MRKFCVIYFACCTILAFLAATHLILNINKSTNNSIQVNANCLDYHQNDGVQKIEKIVNPEIQKNRIFYTSVVSCGLAVVLLSVGGWFLNAKYGNYRNAQLNENNKDWPTLCIFQAILLLAMLVGGVYLICAYYYQAVISWC